MRVSVSEAKGQLGELLRRAEAGGVVVLTDGDLAVKLVPIEPDGSIAARRRAVMEAVQESARRVVTDGPDAARSQDFLYDEYGLPK